MAFNYLNKYFICKQPEAASHTEMLSYHETPVVEVFPSFLKNTGISLKVKREDLNHPFVSGNKWWKLKLNLEEAKKQNLEILLTFGGAYSNHIYATAAAASSLGLRSIGIIRGEEPTRLNKTLQFAKDRGMHLHFISRTSYKDKGNDHFVETLHDRFGDFYLIPEGGTNALAVEGVKQFARMLNQVDCDVICAPVGTGGTLAGLIQGSNVSRKILGFSVLKNGSFLREVIENLNAKESISHWELLTDYAYGGYGKKNEEVEKFISDFFKETSIPLDFVYTAKMMMGIRDLIVKGYFKRGTTILAIHTGGLQGNPIALNVPPSIY